MVLALPPSAPALEDQLAQVVRKALELGFAGRDLLAEDVEGQHRRHGHGDAGGSHDERLADRPRDLVDRDRARGGDAGQRVVDAPDGAEEADEGRLFLGDEAAQKAQLVQRARDAVLRDPATEVQLRADSRVPYGRVAEVIGWLQEAGLTRIGFVTDTPAK